MVMQSHCMSLQCYNDIEAQVSMTQKIHIIGAGECYWSDAVSVVVKVILIGGGKMFCFLLCLSMLCKVHSAQVRVTYVGVHTHG